MTASAEPPRFLTDPVTVITETVLQVEPGLAPAMIAEAVREVACSRAGRRQLARALVGDPSLLTSGRTEGPPLVDRLIRTLRSRGAAQLVQPCCAAWRYSTPRSSAASQPWSTAISPRPTNSSPPSSVLNRAASRGRRQLPRFIDQ